MKNYKKIFEQNQVNGLWVKWRTEALLVQEVKKLTQKAMIYSRRWITAKNKETCPKKEPETPPPPLTSSCLAQRCWGQQEPPGRNFLLPQHQFPRMDQAGEMQPRTQYMWAERQVFTWSVKREAEVWSTNPKLRFSVSILEGMLQEGRAL